MKTTFRDCQFCVSDKEPMRCHEVEITSVDGSIDSATELKVVLVPNDFKSGPQIPYTVIKLGESCHPADDPTDIMGRVEECVLTWPDKWRSAEEIALHMFNASQSLTKHAKGEEVDLEDLASDLILMAAAAIVKARQVDPPAVDVPFLGEESTGTP